MLFVLWLFQVVLLDSFYKSIKTNSIKTAAMEISQEIQNTRHNSQEKSDEIMNIAQKKDVCVLVINQKGAITESAELSPSCIIHHISNADIYNLILTAQLNGNTLLYRINFETNVKLDPETQENIEEASQLEERAEKEMPESIIYVKIMQDQNNQPYAILVNSNITPVDATVQTLRAQLIIIVVIMLIISTVLALSISKRVSRPIIHINNASKQLAVGKYDTDFRCNGYKEIVELGENLNYAARELGKAEQLQKEVIANISHDLRTPLTMITGYAEVMRDLPGENTPENVQVIIDEANRLTTLVNDVLDLSKLQAGAQSLNLQQFNLTQSVQKIMERFAKLKAEEGYQITFDYQEDAWIVGDELKISQVIYNLIINAITYGGDAKQVEIKQSILERLPEHKKKTGKERPIKVARIEVIDHGEGIEPEKLKDIWQRYYKLDKNHQRAKTGTGLGLSIVKTVLDLHKAKYGVESTLAVSYTHLAEILLINPPHIAAEIV